MQMFSFQEERYTPFFMKICHIKIFEMEFDNELRKC